jgi:hypothetical protein
VQELDRLPEPVLDRDPRSDPGTHKVGVVDFTTTRQQPRHFGANQTLTVSAPVTQGALAHLQSASNGQIGGKISARPRTNQRGLIELITLVLG